MTKLTFPNLLQTFEYDCGATAIQSILLYYGIEIKANKIITYAKTDEKSGTFIKDTEAVFLQYGLKYDSQTLSILDLESYLKKKIPVMILLQAWSATQKNYSTSYKDGHWVVAIGFDSQNIYFADPYISAISFIPKKEFKSRWHGKEGRKKIQNYGIAVFGKRPSYSSRKIVYMK